MCAVERGREIKKLYLGLPPSIIRKRTLPERVCVCVVERERER